MADFNIETFKKQLDKLPPISPSLSKILNITNDPKTSAGNLNRAISLDPVLTAKVLKLINSAYFGFDDEITSIVRAIVILGFNTIKNLALSTSVLSSFLNMKVPGFDIEKFWDHLLGVAVISKLIAKHIGYKKDAESFFIHGLLHDIGKLIFLKFYRELFIEAINIAEINNSNLLFIEEELIGINHAKAGSILAIRWKLGKDIIKTINYHHELLENKQENIRSNVVMLANILVKKVGIGFSGNRYFLEDISRIEKNIYLTKEDIDKILNLLDNELENARNFINIIKGG